MTEVHILPDAATAARAAADLLLQRSEPGRHLALAGGSTPAKAYEIAAARGHDFSGVTMWFGDDRAVGPEHEHSNYRMVRESLLERIEPRIHPQVERIMGELGAQAAAGDYDARLRTALGNAPVFDLILLGLGPDSHTASLFPGKPALDEKQRLVVDVPEAGMEPQVPRVTMTLRVLNAAREVVFLVAGADKAQAVRRAFGPDPDQSSPSARVRPVSGRLLVICDEPAATEL